VLQDLRARDHVEARIGERKCRAAPLAPDDRGRAVEDRRVDVDTDEDLGLGAPLGRIGRGVTADIEQSVSVSKVLAYPPASLLALHRRDRTLRIDAHP
jgi:hypothetical protein